jgi:hypothetical protein
MAYVLIGGTAVGTVLTLAFLPALYAIWFRVSYVDAGKTTNRTVAARNAIVIARQIQVLFKRMFLEFTMVSCMGCA